jgi:serine protease Do
MNNYSVSSQNVERELQFSKLAEDVDRFETQNSLLRRAVQLVLPSIVHIEAIKTSSSDATLTSARSEPQRIEEAGAGIMVNISDEHYVITNRHVIHAAELRAIRLETSQHSRLQATRVWSDPSTDIAVVQVQGDAYVPAHLGNSNEIEIGDTVFAVGSPFGLNHSVTSGILSAKGRRNLDLGNRAIDIQDFFQTDAAINPGNSGGPLFNLRGEVIGINTAIASNSGGNEGIGFTIPINLVMTVVEQLVSAGELKRAYLGVQMENQFDMAKARQLGLNAPEGALVKAVRSQSPAESSGLRYGDIILYFNGIKIHDDGHLVQTVGLSPINQPLKVMVLRDGQRIELNVQLKELPPVY